MSLEDSLSECFQYILDNGSIDRQEKWNGHNNLFKVIEKNIPAIITSIFNSYEIDNIKIIGRSGSSGVWAGTAYVCILDDVNRKGSLYSPSKGVYPCFLFPRDCPSFYLTYMLAVGSKKPREISAIKQLFLNNLDISYNLDSDHIHINPDPHHYKEAVLFFKEYLYSDLPTDEDISKDILDFYHFHYIHKQRYFDAFNEVILKK